MPQKERKVALAHVVHAADRTVMALGFSTIDIANTQDTAHADLSQLGLDDTKVCTATRKKRRIFLQVERGEDKATLVRKMRPS